MNFALFRFWSSPTRPLLQAAFCRRMNTDTLNQTPKFILVKEICPSSDDNKELDNTFRVVSYNILAQAYVKSTLFPHSPSPCLRWKARSQAILGRLLSFNADFLCIQELDEFESFYKGHLDNQGYKSLYIKRGGKKRDGCGIFFRHEQVELILSEVIDYNDLVPPNQDGLMPTRASPNLEDCTFKDAQAMSSGKNTVVEGICEDRGDPNDPSVRLKRDCVGIMGAFRVANGPHNLIILANTHLYWDPNLADVKLAQAKYLVTRVLEFRRTVAKLFQCIPPLIICGDFNSMPGDEVYNYLNSGSGKTFLETSAMGSLAVSDLPLNIVNKHQSMPLSELPGKCPLPLHSLYAFVKREPAFTNCTPDFTGTLDYIFFSPFNHLKPTSLLELPVPGAPDVSRGLPNYHHPSDHLPLGADFSLG